MELSLFNLGNKGEEKDTFVE